MKYKIIATAVILVIVVAALALRGCSHNADQDDQPESTQQQQ